MADYFYLAHACKTCKSIRVIKYYGLDDGSPEIIQNFPGDPELQCGKCGGANFHKPEDFHLVILDSPPPEGWKDVF